MPIFLTAPLFRMIPTEKAIVKDSSRWVEKSKALFAAFQASISDPKVWESSSKLAQTILDFLVNRYNQKWQTKKLHPRNLGLWLAQLTETWKERYPGKISRNDFRQLKLAVTRWERYLLENNDFAIRKPHFLSFQRLKNLTQDLWKRHSSRRFPRLYRASSIAFYLAWMSGSRLIDITRFVIIIKAKIGENKSIKISQS